MSLFCRKACRRHLITFGLPMAACWWDPEFGWVVVERIHKIKNLSIGDIYIYINRKTTLCFFVTKNHVYIYIL